MKRTNRPAVVGWIASFEEDSLDSTEATGMMDRINDSFSIITSKSGRSLGPADQQASIKVTIYEILARALQPIT